MFLQTAIETVYWFLLQNFIEDCNQLLPDRAADSARCMGLCAHSKCRSTMPVQEGNYQQMIQLKQFPPNPPYPPGYRMGVMHKAFWPCFETHQKVLMAEWQVNQQQREEKNSKATWFGKWQWLCCT